MSVTTCFKLDLMSWDLIEREKGRRSKMFLKTFLCPEIMMVVVISSKFLLVLHLCDSVIMGINWREKREKWKRKCSAQWPRALFFVYRLIDPLRQRIETWLCSAMTKLNLIQSYYGSAACRGTESKVRRHGTSNDQHRYINQFLIDHHQ